MTGYLPPEAAGSAPGRGRLAGRRILVVGAGTRPSAELDAPVGNGRAISDFDTFADQNPALLDKKLLARFYRSSTLAGTPARTGWVEPDRTPFPWQHDQG